MLAPLQCIVWRFSFCLLRKQPFSNLNCVESKADGILPVRRLSVRFAYAKWKQSGARRHVRDVEPQAAEPSPETTHASAEPPNGTEQSHQDARLA